jgi:CheY-like chemotaxis protein
LSQPVVLVVEDEPLLRLHAVALVEEQGFDAIEARSAEEALDLLIERPDICIVFTDIDLPGGMDGVRLAAAVRDRWPPVELILTSGHVNVRDEDLPERGHFLSKPYDSRQLARALHSFA